MTLAEDIVVLLRAHPKGLSDAAVARELGCRTPQASERCRALADDGVLRRKKDGSAVVNRLVPTDPTATVARRPWDWEGNVQAAVCRRLTGDGWTLLRWAGTTVKEHGPDIEAERDGTFLRVEVRGYPSASDADVLAGESKPNRPSAQARQWYAQTLLKVLRRRHRHPDDAVAMGLPQAARYARLVEETAGTLDAMRVDLYLVGEDGSVTLRERAQPS